MKEKTFNLYAFAWLALYAGIFIFSWLAFSKAYLILEFVYFPLRSLFLPIDLAISDYAPVIEIYGTRYIPNWLLAFKGFKPESDIRLIHELSIWFITLSQISLFIFGFKKIAKKISFKKIFILSAIIGTFATLTLPSDSSDLFAYVARGAQQVTYDQNPYHETVSSIINWQFKPLLANTLWENNPSPYGPLYMLIAKWAVQLSQNNLWISLLIFKFINFGFFLFSLIFLEKFLKGDLFKKLKVEKASAIKRIGVKISKEQIYFLLALNPFVINEVLWNGHNDYIMAVLAFLGIYFAFKGNYNRGVLLIILSALIKYLSIILIPFVLVYACIGDQHKKMKYIMDFKYISFEKTPKVYMEMLVHSIKSIPYYGLMLGGFISFLLFDKYDLFLAKIGAISSNLMLSHKSLYDCCNSLSKYIRGDELPDSAKFIFLGAFILFYFLMIWQMKLNWDKAKLGVFEFKDIFGSSFLGLFVLIAFITSKFHSWYILVFLLPGLLVEPILIYLLSITHMLSFTFLDQANIANYLIMTLIPVLLYYKGFKKIKALT